jgi:hypothetical protein
MPDWFGCDFHSSSHFSMESLVTPSPVRPYGQQTQLLSNASAWDWATLQTYQGVPYTPHITTLCSRQWSLGAYTMTDSEKKVHIRPGDGLKKTHFLP